MRLAISACAVLLLLLGAAGCGDDDDTSTVTATETVSSTAPTESTEGSGSSTTSSSTTEDGAPPPADIMVGKLTGFSSPTGNIGCYIDRSSVRCDVSERDWEPPQAPKSCKLDYGQGIMLSAGAAPEFVCAGDTTLGAGKPLAYGQSIGAGLLRCESAESGMSCTDTESGRGFTISKQSYDLR